MVDEEKIRVVVRNTVHEVFTALGADPTKPIELQQDFAFLRGLREEWNVIKRKAMAVMLTIALTGMAGALCTGLAVAMSTKVN